MWGTEMIPSNHGLDSTFTKVSKITLLWIMVAVLRVVAWEIVVVRAAAQISRIKIQIVSQDWKPPNIIMVGHHAAVVGWWQRLRV